MLNWIAWNKTIFTVLSKELSSTTFWIFGMTTGDWTPVSQAIGEHSTTKPMVQ